MALYQSFHERFDDIGVLLPFTAYSAATLLAMDETQFCSAPLCKSWTCRSPQITSTRPVEGKPQISRFGSEDLVNYLAFVRKLFALTESKTIAKCI